MNLRRALNLLEDFFAAHNAPWAVVGGFALGSLGIVRATYDLDILTSFETQTPLVSLLASRGYETIHVSPAFSHHHPRSEDLPRIDVLYVQAETAEKLFPHCTLREVVPGLEVPVPRPEHLAAMKVQAMGADPARQAHELADLQELLRLPGLDKDEVRGYFVRHGFEREFAALEARLDSAPPRS